MSAGGPSTRGCDSAASRGGPDRPQGLRRQARRPRGAPSVKCPGRAGPWLGRALWAGAGAGDYSGEGWHCFCSSRQDMCRPEHEESPRGRPCRRPPPSWILGPHVCRHVSQAAGSGIRTPRRPLGPSHLRLHARWPFSEAARTGAAGRTRRRCPGARWRSRGGVTGPDSFLKNKDKERRTQGSAHTCPALPPAS